MPDLTITLRVMFIGTDSIYAERVMDELRKSGYEVMSQLARTRKQAAAMIQFSAWDFIVFNGGQSFISQAKMCGLVNKYQAGVPFMVCLPHFDQQQALEAIKAGASDVLVETEIERILPAFKHDLGVARLKRELGIYREELFAMQQILDHAQSALVTWTIENKINQWNSGAERLYGWSKKEVLGKNVQSVLFIQNPSEHNEAYLHALEHGSWEGELEQTNRNGTPLIVQTHWTVIRNTSGEATAIYMAALDITEARKMEERFLQTQRLGSMGVIAGGMAHDLNNVLSPILAASEVLKARIEDPKMQRILETIGQNTTRAARLIRQALRFTRGTKENKQVLHPEYIIRELEDLIRHSFQKSITISVQIDNDVASVFCNAIQLEQVLLNLCINARDSMADGGMLSIKAFNYRPARQNDTAGYPLSGEYVCIAVRDTGYGIAKTEIERIFDPFYTTKPEGQGSGLGLYTARNIIEKHNGFLTVQSEPGKGTEFKVLLPAATGRAGKNTQNVKPEVARGDGETILLVDDEEAILLVMRKALETNNYKVITAHNGKEALEMYARHKEYIKVVLIDIFMPVMGGIATIGALQSINPNLAIIATSAALEPLAGSNIRASDLENVLQKPFTIHTLLLSVGEALAKKAHP